MRRVPVRGRSISDPLMRREINVLRGLLGFEKCLWRPTTPEQARSSAAPKFTASGLRHFQLSSTDPTDITEVLSGSEVRGDHCPEAFIAQFNSERGEQGSASIPCAEVNAE